MERCGASINEHMLYPCRQPTACCSHRVKGGTSLAWLADAIACTRQITPCPHGTVCRLQAVGLVDKILRERADDIIDMDKAVRRVEAERHHQLPTAANEVHLVSASPQGVKRSIRFLGSQHGQRTPFYSDHTIVCTCSPLRTREAWTSPLAACYSVAGQ